MEKKVFSVQQFAKYLNASGVKDANIHVANYVDEAHQMKNPPSPEAMVGRVGKALQCSNHFLGDVKAVVEFVRHLIERLMQPEDNKPC